MSEPSTKSGCYGNCKGEIRKLEIFIHEGHLASLYTLNYGQLESDLYESCFSQIRQIYGSQNSQGFVSVLVVSLLVFACFRVSNELCSGRHWSFSAFVKLR